MKSDIDQVTGRIEAIDVAKGIAICAIVLGHVSKGLLWDTTLIFATAAFFLLSGLTFNMDRKQKNGLLWKTDTHFGDILKKLFKRLLVPYILWGIISIAVYIAYNVWVVGNMEPRGIPKALLDNLLGLIYANSGREHFEWNRPLWFLPCLFVVEIVAYAFLKISEKKNWFQIIVAVLLMLGGLGWMYNLDKAGSGAYIWPFEAETALAMLFFFMFGLIFRKILIKVFLLYIPVVLRIAMIILGAIMIAIIMIMVIQRGGADTRTDLYRGMQYYLLGAGLGITATFFFSCALRGTYVGDKLSYVGKRTMGILVLHKFPVMFGKYMLGIVPAALGIAVKQEGVPFELIFALIVMLITLLVEWIITYFVPSAFGSK